MSVVGAIVVVVVDVEQLNSGEKTRESIVGCWTGTMDDWARYERFFFVGLQTHCRYAMG